MAGSLIVGSIFEGGSILGLLLNSAFLLTLLRYGYLKNDVPFTIIFNICLSYFCHLCTVTFHTGPEVILGHDPFTKELESAAKYSYLCFSFVTLFSQILMTVNRYVAVCRFAIYRKYFTMFRVRFLCILSWLVGLAVAAIPEMGLCCPLVFSTHVVRALRRQNGSTDAHHSSHEVKSSHEQVDEPTELTNYELQTNWMLVITHVVNVITIGTMVVLYLLILKKVKTVGTQVAPHTIKVEPENKQDGGDVENCNQDQEEPGKPKVLSIQQQKQIRRISFQAFTLSFCFTIFSLFQIMVQFAFTNIPMMMILQFSYLVNCSVVPIVFMVLNKKVRYQMAATFFIVSKEKAEAATGFGGVVSGAQSQKGANI